MYLRAVRNGREPAGKVLAGTVCRRQLTVDLPDRIAQNGVVRQLAAVGLENQVAEGQLAVLAGIVAVEDDPQFPDAALKLRFGEAAVLFDPRAPRIGKRRVGIIALGNGLTIAVAQRARADVARHADQRVKLLLRQLEFILARIGVDRALAGAHRLRRRSAVKFLYERKTLGTERQQGRLCKHRQDQSRCKTGQKQDADKNSFHSFTTRLKYRIIIVAESAACVKHSLPLYEIIFQKFLTICYFFKVLSRNAQTSP